MSTTLQDKIGMKLETYTIKVEGVKARELALAIGDLKEEYLKGEKLPPTFPTVLDFWGGSQNTSAVLGLNMKKVLHGEMAYEYVGQMKPGETVTVKGVVEDAYTKAAMNFFVIKKEFYNEQGELVLVSRSTTIERH